MRSQDHKGSSVSRGEIGWKSPGHDSHRRREDTGKHRQTKGEPYKGVRSRVLGASPQQWGRIKDFDQKVSQLALVKRDQQSHPKTNLQLSRAQTQASSFCMTVTSLVWQVSNRDETHFFLLLMCAFVNGAVIRCHIKRDPLA